MLMLFISFFRPLITTCYTWTNVIDESAAAPFALRLCLGDSVEGKADPEHNHDEARAPCSRVTLSLPLSKRLGTDWQEARHVFSYRFRPLPPYQDLETLTL